jgi:hypothetical protein
LVCAVLVGGGPTAFRDAMGILDEPRRPGLGRRGIGQRFPGRIIRPEKPSALELERKGRVHVVIGSSPAFRGDEVGGRISGTSIRRRILVGENHLGHVIARKILLQKRKVIGQLGVDIGSRTVAGEGIGVVVGMVVHVPSRRPQSLQATPVHKITAAPGCPSLIGPGTHNRFPCPPAQRVQKRFAVIVLGQPIVVKGEGIGPMVVIVKGGFGGGTRAAGGPVYGGDNNGTACRGEGGCSG